MYVVLKIWALSTLYLLPTCFVSIVYDAIDNKPTTCSTWYCNCRILRLHKDCDKVMDNITMVPQTVAKIAICSCQVPLIAKLANAGGVYLVC